MYRLSTSYRENVAQETFDKARDFSKQLGVVRVSEVTQLDRIGIPVFTSIRPIAHKKSLSVHAGKGLCTEDARVSALMEAIEFAIVENPRATINIYEESPKSLLGFDNYDRLIQFCPMYDTKIPVDSQIRWIDTESLYYKDTFPVPADLVLFPLPDEPNYMSFFGSSTNGLASGNSVEEASVHGLLEVIERDIESFRTINDESSIIRSTSLPSDLQWIMKSIVVNNYKLICRYVKNQFSIPYFYAVILDSHSTAPIFASEGFGCHPNRKIALVRAITEAAQGRLSHIHGGRDDIIDRFNQVSSLSLKELKTTNLKFEEKITSGSYIDFNCIPNLEIECGSTNELLEGLLRTIKQQGFKDAGRVILSHKNDPVSVVRIIVPKLEAFNFVTKRIGKRLGDYVAQKHN